MSELKVPSDIDSLLGQVCKKKLSEYDVEVEENTGERGYLGEMVSTNNLSILNYKNSLNLNTIPISSFQFFFICCARSLNVGD